jgi:hypothetical protein
MPQKKVRFPLVKHDVTTTNFPQGCALLMDGKVPPPRPGSQNL